MWMRKCTLAGPDSCCTSKPRRITFSLLAAWCAKLSSSRPSVHVFLLRLSSISSSSSFFLQAQPRQQQQHMHCVIEMGRGENLLRERDTCTLLSKPQHMWQLMSISSCSSFFMNGHRHSGSKCTALQVTAHAANSLVGNCVNNSTGICCCASDVPALALCRRAPCSTQHKQHQAGSPLPQTRASAGTVHTLPRRRHPRPANAPRCCCACCRTPPFKSQQPLQPRGRTCS